MKIPGDFAKRLPLPLSITTLLVSIVIFQWSFAGDSLPGSVLVGGRLMVDSGLLDAENSSRNLLDGDPLTGCTLIYPSNHPQGTFLLWDMGLTHFPPEKPGDPLPARKAVELVIESGLSEDGTSPVYRSVGRPKKILLEVHYRQANDPDVDYYFPEPRVVFQKELTLPDSPAPFPVALDLPPLSDSPRYPEGVFLIVGKITVLSTYPGDPAQGEDSTPTGGVAFRELDYIDSPVSPAPPSSLQKNDTFHFWNRARSSPRRNVHEQPEKR